MRSVKPHEVEVKELTSVIEARRTRPEEAANERARFDQSSAQAGCFRSTSAILRLVGWSSWRYAMEAMTRCPVKFHANEADGIAAKQRRLSEMGSHFRGIGRILQGR